MKKLISSLMAVILVVTAFSFNITTYADNMPYLDENGDMVRLCDGQWLTFETSYDDVLKAVKDAFMNREQSVSIRYACTNKTNAEFSFNYTDNDDERDAYCKKLMNKLYYDVLLDDDPADPFDGEYLYHSLTGKLDYSYKTRPNNNDLIAGEKYTNYEITFSSIDYYTSLSQENEIRDFVNTFNEKFNTASHTDYEKVKIIYDFVVRNAEYDNEVFHNLHKGTPRYKIAHSAYGAIKGALLDNEGNQKSEYNWEIQNFIMQESIISTANQGLAVCEGITKLFYLLCESNGIDCKMIDGDYATASSIDSDPHEWAEVYLDDGVKKDGARWYLVDPTFAIQRSIKEVHFNNYDYFLRGTASDSFNSKNHQTAYSFEKYDFTSNDQRRKPLFNFYSKEYLASTEDYEFSPIDFSDVIDTQAMVLIERAYEFEGKERGSYLLTNSEQTNRVQFDEDGKIHIGEEVKGFVYNGLKNSITVKVPYLVGIEIEVNGDMTNVGPCSFDLIGKNGTKYTYYFNIIPNDMTAEYYDGEFSNDKYSSEDSNIDEYASYTGNTINPEISIVDGYHNKLVHNRDYVINIYTDEERTNKTTIRDIGTYYVDIDYINNYCGRATIRFNVGKIVLNNMNATLTTLSYLPRKMREARGIYTAADEYIQAQKDGLLIGDYRIIPNVDFSVTSSGSLNYGESGTVTLTGLKASKLVEANSRQRLPYTVSEKFDISGLDKSWAHTKPFYSTGSEIKPTQLAELEKNLELGIDYEITGYKNNTKSGKASVFIQGINGCTGSAEMYFQIVDNPNKPNIANAGVSFSNNNNTFSYTLKLDSKTLVKNKDYKESLTVKNGAGGVITCTGIGDYTGTLTLNLPSSVTPPSETGNYITAGTVYTYTGKAIKPTVKLYNSSKKLVNNFFISSIAYSGNTNVGQGKITVKTKNGKTVTKAFTIKPKSTSLSTLTAGKKMFTVKWNKYTTQTTGYQIQYSTDKNFKKNNKTVTVSNNKTTSKAITKLSAKKKYYVRIRTYKTVKINGKSTNIYSDWSKSKSVTTKK